MSPTHLKSPSIRLSRCKIRPPCKTCKIDWSYGTIPAKVKQSRLKNSHHSRSHVKRSKQHRILLLKETMRTCIEPRAKWPWLFSHRLFKVIEKSLLGGCSLFQQPHSGQSIAWIDHLKTMISSFETRKILAIYSQQRQLFWWILMKFYLKWRIKTTEIINLQTVKRAISKIWDRPNNSVTQ